MKYLIIAAAASLLSIAAPASSFAVSAGECGIVNPDCVEFTPNRVGIVPFVAQNSYPDSRIVKVYHHNRHVQSYRRYYDRSVN